MTPRRLPLKPGVSVDRATEVLRGLVDSVSGALPPGRDALTLRVAYEDWVDRAGVEIRNITDDVEIRRMFISEAYWRILELASAAAIRAYPLINAELERQKQDLERLLTDLIWRADRIALASGQPAVLDTNLLLHYQPPWQIPWPAILGVPAVRLLIPLRVIEELDAKKYSDSATLRRRARQLLPQLEAKLGDGGKPAALNDAVTIEVPLEPEPRIRPADADTEILDDSREFALLSGQDVIVVTADTAMTIRAQALGLGVARLPAEHRREREDPGGAATV